MILRYSYGTFSPSYDVAPFFPLFIMTLSLNFDAKCELIELPLFVPNNYLFENHADKVTSISSHNASPDRETDKLG